MTSRFDDLARRKSSQPLERIRSVALVSIRLDGGTQAREELSEETIQDYADVLKNGGTLPDITVFFDGTSYWLADGFHRYYAHERAQLGTISCDIKEGSQRDAILYAAGANDKHGLRRTNADKRRSVLLLLNDEEWRTWSSREIARRTGVDHKTVEALRAELSGEFPQIERAVSRQGQTYKVKTESRPHKKATSQQKFLRTFRTLRAASEKLSQAELEAIAPQLKEAHDYLSGLLRRLETPLNERI
jgi:hypothetical protein